MRFLFVVLAGCSQRAEPPRVAPLEHRDPPPRQLITSTAVGVVRAYDDGSLHVALGDKATCAGTRAPEIEIARRLGPDGVEAWTPISVSEGRLHLAVTGSVRLQPETGGATFDVDVHAKGFDAVGRVTATSCGRRAPMFVPRAEEADGDATMTIAGKRLRIRGAIRHGEDLVLSDAPRGCHPTWISGATLTRTAGQWTLDGERIATPATGDGHALQVELKPHARLSGKATLGAYTVELAGSLELLACEPPEKALMTTKLEIGDDWAHGPTSETVGCVRSGRTGYCYAHLPDGTSVGCELSEFMASYTSDTQPYVQFDWDRNLLGLPRETPQCTGVQAFPSHPYPRSR